MENFCYNCDFGFIVDSDFISVTLINGDGEAIIDLMRIEIICPNCEECTSFKFIPTDKFIQRE